MNTPFRHSRIAIAVAGCVLAFAAGQAQGAAFALAETSGSGLGNAFAGGAAAAEDASTVWANPAGMVRLPMQAVAALHIVTPSIKFNNDGSVPALNQPLGDDGISCPTCISRPRSPRSSSSASASMRRSASSPTTAAGSSGATRASSRT